MTTLRLPLLLVLVALLLSSGCIQQHFYQKMDKDGRSTIRLEYNLSQALAFSKQYGGQYGVPGGLTEAQLDDRMQQSCQEAEAVKPSLHCTARDATVSLELPFEKQNAYYTWEVEDHFPYRVYRLTVNKLPLDRFALSSLAGVPVNNPALAQPVSIDLHDKTAAAASINATRTIAGFAFTYAVEMPAGIIRADAGNYAATISEQDPRVATFDLIDVLSDSEPLVVEAQELNITFVFALVLLALLAGLAFYFLRMKKK